MLGVVGREAEWRLVPGRGALLSRAGQHGRFAAELDGVAAPTRSNRTAAPPARSDLISLPVRCTHSSASQPTRWACHAKTATVLRRRRLPVRLRRTRRRSKDWSWCFEPRSRSTSVAQGYWLWPTPGGRPGAPRGTPAAFHSAGPGCFSSDASCRIVAVFPDPSAAPRPLVMGITAHAGRGPCGESPRRHCA